MEPVDPAVLAEIEASLRTSFRMPAALRKPLGAPDFAYDAKRAQYSAPLVLRRLVESFLPAGGVKLLAVTGEDLYIPMLSFVYGQAQLGGQLAVVSMARLRPEFYGLPADPALLGVRARKEAIHEVGHLFGLVHCPDTSCAMALSTNLRQLDVKLPELCPDCSALATEGRHEIRIEE